MASVDQPGVLQQAPASGARPGTGGRYIGQFDSFRVIACCAVVLQHSLLWTVAAGNTAAWAFVMLLHFSRTAFFFLAAFLLTYSQITRPRSPWGFWRRRYVQIGVPFLAWTGIYWIFTMAWGGSWDQAWPLLWNYVVYGYYQLYFVVVLLLLYLVYPPVLRAIRASSHHVAIMVASLLFALVLAADLHYTSSFGVVGGWTRDIASAWPWARNPITYQEQFVAGILVALHWDEVRSFVERWYRQVIAGAVLMGVAATLWYLVAVWTGSTPGRASDLYQPIAFLWFTAAVAALECGAWMWYRRTGAPPGTRAQVPLSRIPGRPDRAASSCATSSSSTSCAPASGRRASRHTSAGPAWWRSRSCSPWGAPRSSPRSCCARPCAGCSPAPCAPSSVPGSVWPFRRRAGPSTRTALAVAPGREPARV